MCQSPTHTQNPRHPEHAGVKSTNTNIWTPRFWHMQGRSSFPIAPYPQEPFLAQATPPPLTSSLPLPFSGLNLGDSGRVYFVWGGPGHPRSQHRVSPLKAWDHVARPKYSARTRETRVKALALPATGSSSIQHSIWSVAPNTQNKQERMSGPWAPLGPGT